ncbi:MAG: hypothetical protein WB609_10305 [Candidatus Cybelea sp.]
MQTQAQNQMFPQAEAENVIALFLSDADGWAINKMMAREHARRFCAVAEGELGVLVRQGTGELGFLHRSFQEFLTADFITHLPFEQQRMILERHSNDPAWREVLLLMIWLTRRPSEVEQLLSIVESGARGINETAAWEMLAEVSFGGFQCPPKVARRLATLVVLRIERHQWLPHRQLLLEHVIAGLDSPTMRESVLSCLRRWIFCRAGWRPFWYGSIKKWPNEDETRQLLLSVLNDEDPHCQRSAAQCLASISAQGLSGADELFAMATASLLPTARAATLDALRCTRPRDPRLSPMMHRARNALSPELRICAIRFRIQGGMSHSNDYSELLWFCTRDGSMEVHYAWRQDAVEALIEGWAGDGDLLEECLRAARGGYDVKSIEKGIALQILVEAFPQDPSVATCFAAELRAAHPFTGVMRDLPFWAAIATKFRNNPALISAIDRWATEAASLNIPEVSIAAHLGRTDQMKAILLQALGRSFAHWPASTLLECWGTEDSEVGPALMALVSANAAKASEVADLIPQIIRNPLEAETRLLEILESNQPIRLDKVVLGLANLPEISNRHAIAIACLEKLGCCLPAFFESSKSQIIRAFADIDEVRRFAIDSLYGLDPPIGEVAQMFADDAEVRQTLRDLIAPLPERLRDLAVERLSMRAANDEVVASILRDYDVETSDPVSTRASIGYHKSFRLGAILDADVLKRLFNGFQAMGPHYPQRRRAALAGAIELEQLDLILNEESILSPRAVGLSDYSRLNIPLIQLVVEKWDYIKATIGVGFEELFSHGGNMPFWEAISVAALSNTKVAADVISALEANNQLITRPNCLLFLSRAKPASEMLADACLRILHGSAPIGEADPEMAATIFAEHFGTAKGLDRLLEKRSIDVGRTGIVLGLCAGWPESDYVDKLYAEMQSEGRGPMSYAAYFALRYTKTEPSMLSRAIRDDLARGALFLASIREPLVRRLRSDGDACYILAGILAGNPTTSEKTTIPKILKNVNRMSARVVRWCEREVDRQQRRRSPQFGFDLLSGDLRSVELSVRDALDNPL